MQVLPRCLQHWVLVNGPYPQELFQALAFENQASASGL